MTSLPINKMVIAFLTIVVIFIIMISYYYIPIISNKFLKLDIEQIPDTKQSIGEATTKFFQGYEKCANSPSSGCICEVELATYPKEYFFSTSAKTQDKMFLFREGDSTPYYKLQLPNKQINCYPSYKDNKININSGTNMQTSFKLGRPNLIINKDQNGHNLVTGGKYYLYKYDDKVCLIVPELLGSSLEEVLKTKCAEAGRVSPSP